MAGRGMDSSSGDSSHWDSQIVAIVLYARRRHWRWQHLAATWPMLFCLDSMLPKRIDDHATITRESLRAAQERFNAHLKRVGLKHTDQRDTILHTFLET